MKDPFFSALQLFGLVFVLCAGALMIYGIHSDAQDPVAKSPAPTPEPEPSTIGIFRMPEWIAVFNHSTNDWPGGRIWVNGVVLGYRHDFGPIKADSSRTIPLTAFTKRNGEPFQPLRTAAVEVVVRVGEEGPGHVFRWDN
jgi:hypothetical protein